MFSIDTLILQHFVLAYLSGFSGDKHGISRAKTPKECELGSEILTTSRARCLWFGAKLGPLNRYAPVYTPVHSYIHPCFPMWYVISSHM